MKVTSRIASAARGVPAPSLHRRNGVKGSRLASSWKRSLRSETSVAIHTRIDVYTQSCDGEASKFFDTRSESVWILFLWYFGCFIVWMTLLWTLYIIFIFHLIFPKSDLFILHVHLKRAPWKCLKQGGPFKLKRGSWLARGPMLGGVGAPQNGSRESQWSSCLATLFFRTIYLSFHPDLHV